MLLGILVNIIFLHLFFIYYNWEKKQEQEAFARAKFRAELQKIIDEAIANIELDCTWEETSPDTLLDYYIQSVENYTALLDQCIHQNENYMEDLNDEK